MFLFSIQSLQFRILCEALKGWHVGGVWHAFLWHVYISEMCLSGSYMLMYELYTCVKTCIAAVMSDSLQPRGLQPTRLPCPWDSPGKNTGVGHLLQKSHSLSTLIQCVCPGLFGKSAAPRPPQSSCAPSVPALASFSLWRAVFFLTHKCESFPDL